MFLVYQFNSEGMDFPIASYFTYREAVQRVESLKDDHPNNYFYIEEEIYVFNYSS